MIWVDITTASVLQHMPTDVREHYDTWLEEHPHKEERLAVLTANAIREFRDALKSNTLNQVDPRETYLPQSAVRHCESLIYFSLAMEMGLELSSAANSSRTSADVFLRQIPFGRWKAMTDDGFTPSPRWVVPQQAEYSRRALP